ncbi:acyl-CoA dehydrogenase [Auraticoccus sp. F435]|uniref:Acyl-CoA dehydrogenase n=1 Tax=Auraticoccus cholistanensis TaxID=2656650 RepID=A0A6A9UUR2_9ACTN|nr:acyl-CoA dehydrogenase family protein [Auraticoccus cholistanensis]MVA76676.1 acyl-CoA dehydrogenase [Auraticoccus cholistanensis]
MYRPDEEHEALRAAVREVCRDVVAPHAAEADERAEFPQASYDALRAADLHAPHLPERYGGVGADALATCIVVEEIARACASTALVPSVNKLGTMPLLLAGSEELRQEFLPPVAAGEAMFSFALSEPDAGSDVASIRTRAVPEGDGYRIDGVKRWITNAGISRFYTLFAVTEPGAGSRGISAFVVRADDPGVGFGPPEKKLGIRASPTCEVHLEDVLVPASRMVGDPGSGFATAMRTLEHSRITIAAQALGIAQGALDHALAYVQERSQFGRKLAEFQGLQFMLADMGMKIEAARQLTYAAAAKSERGDADLPFFGAAAKCFASDVAMEVTTDAVQLLGGYGYTRDFPVERMMRDAKITQIYEGTNQIQRVVMARQLLSR